MSRRCRSTQAYELRERDRKRAKKAIKDAREWLKDPTPLWARCTNWRLMLKGPLKEPLALPTKGDDLCPVTASARWREVTRLTG